MDMESVLMVARSEFGGMGEEVRGLRRTNWALAGVAQWIEQWLANHRVAGSIPSLGHMPGFQGRSPVGSAGEATTH